MRKAMLLVLVIAILATTALAEPLLDLKALSYDELAMLQEAIAEEMADRNENAPIEDKQTHSEGTYDSDMVQIVGEYEQDISKSAFYFIVVKNIAAYDIELELEVEALDGDGNVLDTDKTREHAVSPEAEAVLIPRFVHLPLEEVESFRFNLHSEKAQYYYAVNSQMETNYEAVEDGIDVTLTNTGTTPINYPCVYALFFRDGEYIDYDAALFYGDGSSEMEAGATEERIIHCYKIFDEARLYTSGEWE